MNAPLSGRGRISPAPAARTRSRSARGPILATRPPWRMRLPTALWRMFQDLISWRFLIAVEVEFRAIIAVHACALRMLSERPAQKDCRFQENAVPAESICAAHSAVTETSAHPVSKSSLKERLHDPTPTQK